jgi:dimethylhistidine N-methyltransferase
MSDTSASRLRFFDLAPNSSRFLEDVLEGLSLPQKQIPPKYFYDETGARLFDAICELPEYYVTRTESAIMAAHANDIAARIGPGCMLIEYGSGSSRKTRLLINSARPALYMPIEIGRETLLDTARSLARDYPWLKVWAVCADYTLPLELPAAEFLHAARRIIYFPGSTIGNFTPEEALQFLKGAKRLAGDNAGMVIGVDLKKSKAALDAAYDDAKGVTAAFNLNLLKRINRELGADFDLAQFRHRAFFNLERGRVEMHLVSLTRQRVTIAGRDFNFGEGETIHTENSYKYTVEEFRALARDAGLTPIGYWLDRDSLFSVHYLASALA